MRVAIAVTATIMTVTACKTASMRGGIKSSEVSATAASGPTLVVPADERLALVCRNSGSTGAGYTVYFFKRLTTIVRAVLFDGNTADASVLANYAHYADASPAPAPDSAEPALIFQDPFVRFEGFSIALTNGDSLGHTYAIVSQIPIGEALGKLRCRAAVNGGNQANTSGPSLVVPADERLGLICRNSEGTGGGYTVQFFRRLTKTVRAVLFDGNTAGASVLANYGNYTEVSPAPPHDSAEPALIFQDPSLEEAGYSIAMTNGDSLGHTYAIVSQISILGSQNPRRLLCHAVANGGNHANSVP